MDGHARITRRLGASAAGRCYSSQMCPNVFELADGDFIAVGEDVTAEMSPLLPPDAGCAPHERIIRLPRRILVGARAEIPAA